MNSGCVQHGRKTCPEVRGERSNKVLKIGKGTQISITYIKDIIQVVMNIRLSWTKGLNQVKTSAHDKCVL